MKKTSILLSLLLITIGLYSLTLSIKKRSAYNKHYLSYSQYVQKERKLESTRSRYLPRSDDDALRLMYLLRSSINEDQKSIANYSLISALLMFTALFLLLKKKGLYLKPVIGLILLTHLWAVISLSMKIAPSAIILAIPALMLILAFKSQKNHTKLKEMEKTTS